MAGRVVRARVDVVAPSGTVVEAELRRGLARLESAGFECRMSAGLLDRRFVFAGDDATRAAGVWAAACAEDSDVVWCARGGYGAARILPELERLTFEHGTPPHKLLCGFSDITALHEFVRSRWGWSSLHCDVPCATHFATMDDGEWRATVDMVRARRDSPARPAWEAVRLRSFGPEPLHDLTATLVGGNLTVLTSLVGTPFESDRFAGRLLFLEDVSEAPYRIDRYLNQLVQSGTLRGVRAVVLGTFEDCDDAPGTTTLPTGEKVPVRPKLDTAEWMNEVFGDFARRTRIPVVGILPVGHGDERAPLPLGATYRLTVEGRLELLEWSWFHAG